MHCEKENSVLAQAEAKGKLGDAFVLLNVFWRFLDHIGGPLAPSSRICLAIPAKAYTPFLLQQLYLFDGFQRQLHKMAAVACTFHLLPIPSHPPPPSSPRHLL